MLVKIGNKLINPEFIIHGEQTREPSSGGILTTLRLTMCSQNLKMAGNSGFWVPVNDEVILTGEDVFLFYSVAPLEFPTADGPKLAELAAGP